MQASLVDDGTVVYLDHNNNQKLDPGEISTTTIQGTYYFDHVQEGAYTVRLIDTHARIVGQLPHGTASHDQVIQNADINIDHPTGHVPIHIYLDTNSNGRKDYGEAFLRKGIISIDSDGDGIFEKSESWRFTTKNGGIKVDFFFGTTQIRFQTLANSKSRLYSRSFKVNITNPGKNPRLMIGLRPH